MLSQNAKYRWDFVNADLPHQFPIFDGNVVNSDAAESFDVQSVYRGDHWASVVTLLNVRPHHAGMYQCKDAEEDLAKTTERGVCIIVKKLECSVNFTDVTKSSVYEMDSVQVSCRVSYVGDLQPVFRCRPDNGTKTALQTNETSTQSSSLGKNNVTSVITTLIYDHVITVTRQQQGVPLTCTVEMTLRSELGMELTVNKTMSWTSNPLNVYYRPKINHSSKDNNIVTCSVGGDPTENVVTWSVNPNNANVGGNQLNMCELEVVQEWVNGDFVLDEGDLTLLLECIVSINNRNMSESITISRTRRAFKEACKTKASALLTMGACAGTLFLIVIVLATTCICIRRQRTKEQSFEYDDGGGGHVDVTRPDVVHTHHQTAIYAEVENNRNGSANEDEQTTDVVYTEVKKKTKGQARVEQQSADVYAEVIKQKRDSDEYKQTTEVYAEVTAGKEKNPDKLKVSIANAMYASIDHTMTLR